MKTHRERRRNNAADFDDKYMKADNYPSDDYSSEQHNGLQSEKSAYSAFRSKLNAEKQLKTDVLQEQLERIQNDDQEGQ